MLVLAPSSRTLLLARRCLDQRNTFSASSPRPPRCPRSNSPPPSTSSPPPLPTRTKHPELHQLAPSAYRLTVRPTTLSSVSTRKLTAEWSPIAVSLPPLFLPSFCPLPPIAPPHALDRLRLHPPRLPVPFIPSRLSFTARSLHLLPETPPFAPSVPCYRYLPLRSSPHSSTTPPRTLQLSAPPQALHPRSHNPRFEEEDAQECGHQGEDKEEGEGGGEVGCGEGGERGRCCSGSGRGRGRRKEVGFEGEEGRWSGRDGTKEVVDAWCVSLLSFLVTECSLRPENEG